MLLRLTILACLAISSATAEPQLEHAAAYGYGAHLFGGINPELYTAARAMAPVQYASSVPMVYANQLMASPPYRASAPLQYAASLPVSYAAPQASLAYSSPYASHHPHAHLAYGVQTPLTASYAAAAAAPSTQFHTPTQYASYAAAPVHAGHAALLGSASASAPSSSSLNYAAALANAQAYGGSTAYAQQQQQQQQLQQYLQQQLQQQQHQQSHNPFHQQYLQQQQQQHQSYQQQLDAAFGRSAAELYGRGVPFAFSGGSQVASSAASSEIARQMAVQLSPGYQQQQAASAYGDARAQARTDSE
nr:box A-binding factor-like isoform X1 [Aedes albopictus]